MRRIRASVPPLTATAAKESELSTIEDFVHDYWFEIGQVSRQSGTEININLFTNQTDAVEPDRPADAMLTIASIETVTIEDRQQVGLYDVKAMTYERPFLTITTGIPLLLKFEVTRLSLQLTTVAHARPKGGCIGAIAIAVASVVGLLAAIVLQ